jgi:rhodanese-related sulfurtransferase
MSNQEKFHISAKEFADKYRSGELLQEQIIDVREIEEWNMVHLEHTQLIPLQTLPNYISEMDPNRPVYVLCAHGVRSIHACNFLYHNGIENVMNVDGGLTEVMIYMEDQLNS